jgi:hypothetical protein
MADVDKQRTKLSAAVATGLQTVTVTDNVDWQNNDYVWVGIGGDPSVTPTTSERVQITRVAVNQFSATFAYSHAAGDHTFNCTRNFVIQSSADTKSFYITNKGTSTDNPSLMICVLEWVQFIYGGYYSIGTVLYDNTRLGDSSNRCMVIATGCLSLKNLVADLTSPSTSSVYGFVVQTDLEFEDQESTFLSNLHGADRIRLLSLAVYGVIRATTITIIKLTGYTAAALVIPSSYNGVTQVYAIISGFWCSGIAANSQSAVSGFPAEFTDFEVHNVHTGIYTTDGYVHGWMPLTIADGHFYWISDAGVYLAGQYSTAILHITDVIFRRIITNGVRSDYYGSIRLYITNCSFDDVGYDDTFYEYGASQALGAGSYTPVHMEVTNCTFGTIVRNGTRNCVCLGDSAASGCCIFYNCVFKAPQRVNYGQASGYTYYTLAEAYALRPFSTVGDWRYQMASAQPAGIELMQCTVQDGSGVTIWSPDRYCRGSQGAKNQLTTESENKLDTTFATTVRPFHTGEPAWGTRRRPISIPIKSGRVLAVKLSVKKNWGGQTSIPTLHLRYPGGYASTVATAALFNTWEELTVSGSAAWDGVAQFWVTGGSNLHFSAWGEAYSGGSVMTNWWIDGVTESNTAGTGTRRESYWKANYDYIGGIHHYAVRLYKDSGYTDMVAEGLRTGGSGRMVVMPYGGSGLGALVAYAPALWGPPVEYRGSVWYPQAGGLGASFSDMGGSPPCTEVYNATTVYADGLKVIIT